MLIAIETTTIIQTLRNVSTIPQMISSSVEGRPARVIL
jgi:hypothetical protein